jgi:endonuclease-3 related protein
VSLYAALRDGYGPQYWWPGESPFEVAVGAILVQRTTWENAARAIACLKDNARFTAAGVLALTADALATRIRPAGFYRAKSRCLRGFCQWLLGAGGFPGLGERPTAAIRNELLSLTGIGPETADCILLYALGRPVFVVDAYTRRVLVRTGLLPTADRLGYESLRAWFETRLRADAEHYGEYHALLVAHGKAVCRVRPRCRDCRIAGSCDYGRDAAGARATGPSGSSSLAP